jgi:F-type H+-transporting ATPase subunit alpha
VGLSVSRVGGEAQIKAMRKVAGRLRILLAQYRELAVFSQFASDLDKSTREALDNGIRLMHSLVQPQYSPYPVEDQVILLQMAIHKTLLDVPIKNVRDFNQGYLNYILATRGEIKKSIAKTGDITDEQVDSLNKAAAEYKEQYMAKLTAELD